MYATDMLDLRCTSVTLAAGELKEQGLIEFQRGKLRLLALRGREAVSCCAVRSSCCICGALSPSVRIQTDHTMQSPHHGFVIHESGGPMNIHETLTHVFPSVSMRSAVPDHGGFFEVRGLRRGMAPKNCEKLASGSAKARIGEARRESYLVRTPDFLLFFRTCPERGGKETGGFAMSCGFAPLFSTLASDLEAYALRSIAAAH